MNSIAIVAHKYLPQPDDELVAYLNHNNFKKVIHIYHSFSDAKDRKSFYRLYTNGKLSKEKQTIDYSFLPEPLLYLKELFYTFFWLIFQGRIDVYIGMDGLCVLFGNWLKTFYRVHKTIYWAIDFVPESRFKNKWKNKIYHFINTSGYKNSDEMWDLSPRMAEAREKFLGIKESEYKLRKVVPYGMWVDRIKKYSYLECEKNTLVFMGHLLEKQGVQLIIKSLPEILKLIPNLTFKIIGDGNYRSELESLAEQLRVKQYCKFLGKIQKNEDLENEIAKSCVAIAPYMKELDTWTYYADPGKVKTYLACGVPVLLTDIPWNAKEIEKNQCGVLIQENSSDIASKLAELMQGKQNQMYRDNSVLYAKQYTYTEIFNGLHLLPKEK